VMRMQDSRAPSRACSKEFVGGAYSNAYYLVCTIHYRTILRPPVLTNGLPFFMANTDSSCINRESSGGGDPSGAYSEAPSSVFFCTGTVRAQASEVLTPAAPVEYPPKTCGCLGSLSRRAASMDLIRYACNWHTFGWNRVF
jgi:hypothetical protein